MKDVIPKHFRLFWHFWHFEPYFSLAFLLKIPYTVCIPKQYFDHNSMHISWLGGTSIKIQTKYADSDVTVLIDPYKYDKGAFPRSLTADVVLLTRGSEELITLSGDPFTRIPQVKLTQKEYSLPVLPDIPKTAPCFELTAKE